MSDARHQKAEGVPTWVLPRGYFVVRMQKGEHSLSVCAADRGPHFVAPSIIFVNTDKGTEVANEPGSRT